MEWKVENNGTCTVVKCGSSEVKSQEKYVRILNNDK